MKQGWEIKKIGDVSDIFNGGTPDTKVPKYWDGDILWILQKIWGNLKVFTLMTRREKLLMLV